MGFPLRSNIFRSGTNEQAYFAHFPVQVAVLCSPTDEDFLQAFKEMFLDLDRITGENLAFFAVLDPPQDWQEAARNREWWQKYKNNIGESGFTFDDKVLVKEISRLFGIEWHSLPSIVVGTNLWTGEYIASGTSPYHIKRQLEVLTSLVHEWGRPNISHILDTLESIIGFDVEYHPPDDNLRFRLNRTYGVLDTLANPNQFEHHQYQHLVENEFRTAENALRRVRQYRDSEQRVNHDDHAVEIIFEDAAGRLVAPATVASKVYRNLRHDINSDIIAMLSEESLVMAETALTVGNFLEGVAHNVIEGITPFRLDNRVQERRIEGRRWSYSSIDFTPGAQGAWKAFELEINLSIIQAARASRTVKMPELFTLYDCNLPKDRAKVETQAEPNGKKVYKDINQKEKRTQRHRFLPLGDAWHIAKSMSASSLENFNSVIISCLGQPLPAPLIDAWEQIYLLRNKASHTRALHMNEYAIILRSALSPEVLQYLVRIKDKLSGHQRGYL